MPIYPGRRKGTWRVTVTVGGHQHEQIVEGTKAEARAHEARRRLELAGRTAPSTRTAPSFASFCVDVYAPHARTHLSASTWGKVRRYQVETLCGLLGRLRLTEIDAGAIESYKEARSRDVAATSVNNELRVLRVILAYARELRYPCADPRIKRLPERGSGRVHAWSAAEVRALYRAALDVAPELVPLLVFLANTGCRKGEALAAERSWVVGDMLRIPVSDVWRPKNGKPREVPISSALAPYLATVRHERWLHPSTAGGRYAAFPEQRFRDVVKAAGLDGSPHTLRHSFASAFLAAVPDMFLLAQVLGHSHARVTEIYSHLLPDHLARARDAVSISPLALGASPEVEAFSLPARNPNTGGETGGGSNPPRN